jgi:AcrR family transcriptional regulator
MEDSEFDIALVGAAMATAGEKGWRAVTVARAAERAGLDLGRARARFPGKLAVLLRLGVIADQSALAGAGTAGPVRDRLFDMIMQRLDVFQTHREGMQALFRALPADPALALLLLAATRRSMAWLLDAAGVSTAGLPGALRVRGLTVVWLAAVRAWARDDSADLAATMRAVDDALQRAERAADWAAPWLGGGGRPQDEASAEPMTPTPVEDMPPLPAAPLDTPPEPEPPPPPMV